jgi:hypothetical protein
MNGSVKMARMLLGSTPFSCRERTTIEARAPASDRLLLLRRGNHDLGGQGAARVNRHLDADHSVNEPRIETQYIEQVVTQASSLQRQHDGSIGAPLQPRWWPRSPRIFGWQRCPATSGWAGARRTCHAAERGWFGLWVRSVTSVCATCCMGSRCFSVQRRPRREGRDTAGTRPHRARG